MGTSEFWRKLAEEFRSIRDPDGLLYAEWTNRAVSDSPDIWSIHGHWTRSVRVEFEALARRAAQALDPPKTVSLLDAWLDLLKKERERPSGGKQWIVVSGNPIAKGQIKDLTRVSADLCKILEGRMLEVEHSTVPNRRAIGTEELHLSPEQAWHLGIPWALADQYRKDGPTPSEETPASLRTKYFSNFPNEKILVLDICWAAGQQHYSEWKRWLRGAVKTGSTPDREFRAILTSGKKPLEYNKRPRPPKWK